MIIKNFEIYKKPETPFKVSRPIQKNPAVDFRIEEKIRLEKSIIVSLVVCIVVFLIFPTYKIVPKKGIPGSNVIVYTDVIPQTSQSAQRRRQPERPAIPIPAETEEMAEDVTIDFENISFSDLPPLPGNIRGVPNVTISPRIIRQVIPSIPKKDNKKGIKGTINVSLEVDADGKVTDVIVLKSTIDNPEVVKAVVDAAYRCLFVPARRGSKNVKDRTFLKYDIDYSR